MKKVILSLAIILSTVLTGTTNAQMTPQVVSISPSYTNQTYYSLSNGVVSSISNTDWDLGFQIRGYAASIIINSKNSVKLYRANKAVSEWGTMVAGDTSNVVSNASFELTNSDITWDLGAFNGTYNAMDPTDLGWGMYDFTTHIVTGDSVYFIKLNNGSYKKFQIIDLASGEYNFRWADLDGSNEQNRSLSKLNYTGKFFAYYSIQNDVAIDREPVYNTWDLVFNQYLSVTPFTYMVTGILMNDSVFATKAYPVDPNTVTFDPGALQSAISTIGYDWKAFDLSSFSWVIADSTVYFVQDRSGNAWKMIFTGFGGSANGDFYFDKGPATTVGIGESSSIQTLGLYPNPASTTTRVMVNMISSRDVQMQLMDVSGRVARTMELNLDAGIRTIDVDLNGLTPGLYTLVLSSGADRQVSRVVVQ